MSAQYPKVTVSPTKEKIQFESPNLSVMKNVTTVSIVTVTTSESTVLSAGSCPLEATTLPSNGTTVPSKVTTPSPESSTVPPKGTTESTVSVNPPRPEVSVPSVESVSSDILESTEIVPLEVTSSETTIESVPPVLSVDSVLLLSTDVTSDSIESIIPVAETIFGSTESAPLDVTSDQSIESLPSVPVESIVESTESSSSSSSVHLEYSTSESAAESVPSTDQNTDPSVVTKPTEGVAPVVDVVLLVSNSSIASACACACAPACPPPPESAVVSVEGVVPPDSSSTGSAPSKVTDASTENSNPPTAANVGTAPSPGLTVASSLTCGADQDQLRAKARDDAINLNRAFQGFGCDAATIVNILSKRSATNRILIKEEYKAKFSEDFDNRLSKELTFKPDLKRAVLLWMDEPACRDAKLVKHGLSTQINVAIEVICSRTPSQIEQLKKAYRKMFDVYLLEDIESHARFDHKKLLLEYAGKQRLESPEVDEMKVDEDAKILFRDGEWKPGTNEETFIRILSERSSAHLTALNSAYRTMYVNSLKKAVKKETLFKFKLILKFALLTILQCAENPAKYFAKALHKAMEGIGTDDETLTRIIVSRAEVDIQQIKAEYEKKYGKALADDVHSDTSKHYRAFLLSLLNFNAA